MFGRDLFAAVAAGFADPTLRNLIELLPEKIRHELLGVADESEVKARVRELAANDAKDDHDLTYATAELILLAGTLEREDLEPVLSRHGVTFGNTDSNHDRIYDLIKKLELPKAKLALDAVVKPNVMKPQGTFADYAATDLDLSKVKPQLLEPLLQAEIEERISPNKTERRRVRVKITWASKTKRLIVGIYFQRPNADGRDIDEKRRLITKSYAQPAASTFVTMKRGRKRVIVTFRSPNSQASQKIRQALSQAFWGAPSQVQMHPMASYKLSVFRDQDFSPTILREYEKDIGAITFSDVQLSIHSGNTVAVRARGKGDDALEDFHKLAKSAKVLAAGDVEKVTLKFLSTGPKPTIVTTATVQPRTVALNELYRGLVEDHLEDWGVRLEGDEVKVQADDE